MTTGDWAVNLFEDGTRTADGGRKVMASVTHRPTSLTLSGYIFHYEDEPSVLAEVMRDDLGLPLGANARLLIKVFNLYANSLYDVGGGGITVWPDLLTLVDEELYDGLEDGPVVCAMLQAAIDQHPSCPPTEAVQAADVQATQPR